jgi:hypothetical protein
MRDACLDVVQVRKIIVLKNKSTKPEYPPDHQAGMRVPKGGSDCAKCEYLAADRTSCTNKFFIAWKGPNKPAGSSKIPAPIDEYCSDWFETK